MTISMSRKALVLVILCVSGVVGTNVAAMVVLYPNAWPETQNAYDYFKNGAGPGFLRRVYFDDNGVEHRYVVFVPYHIEPGVRPPLLMFLHGFSLNGHDGVRHIHECLGPAIWETRSVFPFIVLFPQCPVGTSWAAHDMAGELAMTLLKKTQREYNIDPDRIYLTGPSSGGNGVWSLASSYP